VEDVAHGFVLATFSDKALGETFNLTRGEGRSAKEISDILQSLSDHPLHIESVPATQEDLRWPERGALDITKARKMLGYDPKHSLEDGMKKYYDYMKKYYEKRSR
jgi:nucleoside-diphosphate-sugar epimerase